MASPMTNLFDHEVLARNLTHALRVTLSSGYNAGDGPAVLSQIDFGALSVAVVAVNRERFQALTRCEREVVDLVGRSLGNRGIARQLGKSEKTIANELTTIYRKVGVSSRAELARCAALLDAQSGVEQVAVGEAS